MNIHKPKGVATLFYASLHAGNKLREVISILPAGVSEPRRAERARLASKDVWFEERIFYRYSTRVTSLPDPSSTDLLYPLVREISPSKATVPLFPFPFLFLLFLFFFFFSKLRAQAFLPRLR